MSRSTGKELGFVGVGVGLLKLIGVTVALMIPIYLLYRLLKWIFD